MLFPKRCEEGTLLIIMQTFDLIVVGGGPAGYRAALEGARLGARTALIEKDTLGGTCVNRGCIPTKAIRASVMLYHKNKQASEYGVSVANCDFDFHKILSRTRTISASINKSMQQVLSASKVTHINAAGKLITANTIEIAEEKITAQAIIVATGSQAKSLPGMEFDHSRILAPEDFLNLKQLPGSVLIVGAGVNGCEWAFLLAALGVKVKLVELESQILPGEDPDLARILQRELGDLGVEILTSYQVDFNNEDTVEKILLSVGRKPSGAGLDLVEKNEQGWVAVNDNLRTNLAHVYAAGDVIGPPLLAYTAELEGVIAARNALGQKIKMEYSCVPKVVFTYPELASVGLTAAEAKVKGYDVGVVRSYFKPLGRAIADGETTGMIKVIYDKSNYILLGVGIVGNVAGELISEAVLVLKQGLTVQEWKNVLHPHPVFAEIFSMALDKVK